MRVGDLRTARGKAVGRVAGAVVERVVDLADAAVQALVEERPDEGCRAEARSVNFLVSRG